MDSNIQITDIDDLINQALDTQDYEWAKELVQFKIESNTNCAIAAENIIREHAILENGKLRNFKKFSEEEFLTHEMVRIKDSVNLERGKLVYFKKLDYNAKMYLLGYYTAKNEGNRFFYF